MLWLKVLELTIKKSLDGRILNLTFPLLLSFYSFSSIYDREKQDKKAKKKLKFPELSLFVNMSEKMSDYVKNSK